MNQFKKALVATGASLVLTVGAAGAVSADGYNNNYKHKDKHQSSSYTRNDDHSTNYTVNGNCSGIVQTTVDQNNHNSTHQYQKTHNGNYSGWTYKNKQHVSSDPSQSNSTDQNNSSTVTFAPDCSTTTNVTQQVAATTAAAQTAAPAAQVQAPTGGVSAGEGGSVGSALAPVIALGGSIATLGAGVVRLRKAGFSFTA